MQLRDDVDLSTVNWVNQAILARRYELQYAVDTVGNSVTAVRKQIGFGVHARR